MAWSEFGSNRSKVDVVNQKVEDLADRYIEEANKYNAKIYVLLLILNNSKH